MNSLFHFDVRALARWSLGVLVSGWMLGATWVMFIQPVPVYTSYGSPESRLAKCKNLPTSEARYNCTSQIMLAKDNATFNKVLVVVLPPLALLIGYIGVAKLFEARNERSKRLAALMASRKRMAQWRSNRNDARPAADQSLEEIYLEIGVRPSAIPTRHARRQ